MTLVKLLPFPVLTLLTALSVFFVSSSYAQNFNFAAVTGTYTGEVYNGGDFDPLVTIFKLSTNGRLSGDYTIDDETGMSAGVLSSVIIEGPYTLTLEWTDKDGEGLMQIEFSENFQQFSGFWGLRGSPDTFPINGKK